MMIRVVGTVVVDMIARTNKIPNLGETVLGSGGLRLRMGGKGLNQAIFAAQALSETNANGTISFESCVGDDTFGAMAKRLLDANSVEHRLGVSKSASTGTGSIFLNQLTGENSIVVNLGANQEWTATDSPFSNANVILGQLELPLERTLQAFQQGNGLCILNAAPIPSTSSPVLNELLLASDVLVINQVEAEMLGGKDESLKFTARSVLNTRMKADAVAVIVTLGKDGAFWMTRSGSSGHLPGTPDIATDSVGAGDFFVASFAVEWLSNPGKVEHCVNVANRQAGAYVATVKEDFSLAELS